MAPDLAHLTANSGEELKALPLFDRKGWKRMPFGAFAESVNERVEPANAADEIYVGLDDLDSGDLHIRRWGKGSDVIGTKLRFRKGDIIFGRRRAYQRKLAVAEFDGICSAHAMVVRAKQDVVLPEFLPFLMMSDRFMKRAVEISVGSLSPTINWTTLKLEEFDLPPPAQQRIMAEVLWALDGTWRSLQSLEAALNRALHAQRDDFFSVRANGKTKRVEELFEVQLGKMLSPKAKKGTSLLPYLGNKNVQWGHFELSDVLQMDFSASEAERFSLRVGDLLVCEGGVVGRCAIWDGSIPQCCFQKAIHRLRPLTKGVTSEYMFQFMVWAASKGLFTSLTGHSTIAHLTAVKLKSLTVPLPQPDEQEEFLAKIDKHHAVLQFVVNQQHDTEMLRSAMLSAIVDERG